MEKFKKMTIIKQVIVSYYVLILLFVLSFIGSFKFQEINHLQEDLDGQIKESLFFLHKEIDHLNWLKNLNLSLLTNKEIEAELNHKNFGLGKWYYSNEVNKIKNTKVKSLIAQIEAPHKKVHSSVQEMKAALNAGAKQKALFIFNKEIVPSLNTISQIFDKIGKEYQNSLGSSLKTTNDSANSGKNIIMVVNVLSLIAATLLALFVPKNIAKSLNKIIDKMHESSMQVSSASDNLSSSSNQLAESTNQQASSLQQTSATLEESSSMVQQNNQNTQQAAILAKQTKDFASKSNAQMGEMMESMEELKKSSDEISKIIRVIEEIAFQTNILALNAAVEAARAGEAGSGFAVVAEEVRNLAQRSAKAAHDSAEIIESNIKLSDEGCNISKAVYESLNDIDLQAKKVSELLDEISVATNEQSQGIGQINKAISQMESVVQNNANTAVDNTSSSHQLSNQAGKLTEMVTELTMLVHGNLNRISSQSYEDTYSYDEAPLETF